MILCIIIYNRGYRKGDAMVYFTKKGSIRGNHYHKAEKQINYVLEGEIEFLTKRVDKDSKIKKFIARISPIY